MAERTDPVTGRTTRTDDPEAIAQDIRHTRAEMSETIDSIGARLDPSRLADQAKDAFTSSAKDAGAHFLDTVKDSSVLDTIKENPLPAAAVGLSIAWFLSKMGESHTERYRRERFEMTGDPYYAPRARYGSYYAPRDSYYASRPYGTAYGAGYGYAQGDEDESLKEKASDALDSAKDKAGDLVDKAKDAVGGATHSAQDRAHDAGDQARMYGRRATSWLDHQMHQNPLGVGAVALAAGALVGLSLPETRFEDDLMGEQADRVKDQAQHVAEDKMDQVKAVASDVADDAKKKAKEVADDAKSSAQSVANKAKSEAKDVKDTAKAEAKTSGTATTGTTSRTTGSATSPSSTTTRGTKR